MALPGPIAFERAGLACWPGLDVLWDGSWVRRAAGGYTKRANSAQCFDPADDTDVAARVADARRWFEARALRPVFRLTPLTGPNLRAHLDAEGWQSIDLSHQMALELGDEHPDPRGDILPLTDPAFLAAQRDLKHLDDGEIAKLRAVLGAIAVPAAGIVLRNAEGRAVSSALTAVSGGIAITGNVVTDAAERRQGFGAAMMRTVHAWAKSAGATIAALNVQADNAAGVALYQNLGYRRRYDYVYRIPGPT